MCGSLLLRVRKLELGRFATVALRWPRSTKQGIAAAGGKLTAVCFQNIAQFATTTANTVRNFCCKQHPNTLQSENLTILVQGRAIDTKTTLSSHAGLEFQGDLWNATQNSDC